MDKGLTIVAWAIVIALFLIDASYGADLAPVDDDGANEIVIVGSPSGTPMTTTPATTPEMRRFYAAVEAARAAVLQ